MKKVIIFTAILLTGCYVPAADSRPPFHEDVRIVYLKDGTKCALYRGSRAEAGLSCDWEANRE